MICHFSNFKQNKPKWAQISPNELKWAQTIPNKPKWAPINLNKPKWAQTILNKPKWALRVEEYSTKTLGCSLNSNASTICSNSIWIFYAMNFQHISEILKIQKNLIHSIIIRFANWCSIISRYANPQYVRTYCTHIY